MLALQNIEMMNGMGVKKIITQCPHCFNTLKNEYPQLGGHYEVVHHSEFLEHLIETGKLDMRNASLEDRIVYHDSCYLGRHNDVYMAPRKVVGSIKGLQIVEMPRNGTQGMCCGAGGARMWMEESVGVKVNDIVESDVPNRRVFNPQHPSADAEGYVTHSNVNPVEEMVSMISASRSYQNNVEVMNTAKSLLLKTLQMGQ
jgi:flagellar basal-body rod protein FlgC